jgi:hypothetical protein
MFPIKALADLAQYSRDTFVQAAALEALAVADGNHPLLLDLITAWSEDLQPRRLRLSAATALQRSKLLHDTTFHVAPWMAALALLQDEELTVREIVRAAVAPVLRVQSTENAPSDMAILPLAVSYLASVHGGTNASLCSALSLYVSTYALALAPRFVDCIHASNEMCQHVALCDKIFDAESGNDYRETDMLVQFVTWYFIVPGFITVQGAVEHLIECLSLWASSLPTQAWIGGTTFFPEIFARLHNLVLVAVAQLSRTDAATVTRLQALARRIVASESSNMHVLLRTALSCIETPSAVASAMYLTPMWHERHHRQGSS